MYIMWLYINAMSFCCLTGSTTGLTTGFLDMQYVKDTKERKILKMKIDLEN